MLDPLQHCDTCNDAGEVDAHVASYALPLPCPDCPRDGHHQPCTDCQGNTAWRVRLTQDIRRANPAPGQPHLIPAGTEGSVYPFSLGDQSWAVVFDYPYRGRFGSGSLLVPRDTVELVDPAATDAALHWQGLS